MFTGSGVAIVTPFKNELIDYDKLERLLNWHIEQGTDSIIICGTTGESATMSLSEKQEVIKFAVDIVDRRIPVIAGTGSNCTRSTIELSKYAESVGVDGLLLVTPYYNKATQDGLLKHFTMVADEVAIPIVLYNVPGRTGVNIDPSTVFELSKHKNIRAIKEASGDIAQVAEIARLLPKHFYIYSGNDDSIVPLLSLGGHGVISVVANILPKETHQMVKNYLDGNIEEARKLQLNMKPLIDSLFIEVNPIPVREAMNLLGMDVGQCRMPLTPMSKNNRAILEKRLEEYGLDKIDL